jgi:hypothetical protein
MTLERLEYAKLVIQEVHRRTIHGEFEWKVSERSITAQPTAAIEVSISYLDEGPDAAIWDYIMIGHPVGKGSTMVGNPASPKAEYCQTKAAGQMLDQMNDIFLRVLLDPRKRDFEAAIKQLHES